MAQDLNLADYYLFDRLDEGLGDKDAILFGEQRWTYQRVADCSQALAAYFVQSGVKAEQRVLTALTDTPAFAASFFATLRCGAVVAMANPHSPTPDLAYLLSYSRCAALVTTPAVAKALQKEIKDANCCVVLVPDVATGEDVMAQLDVDSELQKLGWRSLAEAVALGQEAVASGQDGRRRTVADDLAIWLFTSGSTGRPKAAMHSHRDFRFNTERYAINTVRYHRDDITVSVPNLYFGYATGTNLMFPFRVGASTGLFAERPTPASLAEAIARYRPTVVTNVPTMMAKLLDDDDSRRAANKPPLDLSCVRFHLSAGEALPPALLERFTQRFGAEVYDGIGSAEMFHIYCSNRPGDVKPGSLGRVVEGYAIRLLEPEASGSSAPEVPVGDTGVMWIRGDSVAHGYFQEREKSWQTFHGHWCRSGDLFAKDEDGYFWFKGRADAMLKVSGIWVAPLEVENCLMEHESVSSAAVIGASFEGLIKPKAFIVLKAEAEPAPSLAAELKDWVKSRLSKHKYPRSIVFMDQLPKNDRGKIDRRRLESQDANNELPTGY